MKYIFFSIIILVTALPAIYSASRFCSNLSFITWIKWVVIPVYIILFLSLLASLIAGQAAGARLESILLSAGFSFLVATIYFSFFFIAYDLIVLIIKVSGLYKLIPDSGLRVAGELFTVAVLITTAALMVWGHHRFNNPVVTAMEIDLGRGRPSEELNVVIASDLHLGNNIGRADLERFVQLINRSEADIVLLAGDITDNRLKPLISQNMNKL
ncbi:MAG: hypothetical protein M0P27_10050, partial [Bacteroidales bacterium]|nr:hypothetical protein [Bacteroidales bacterium]